MGRGTLRTALGRALVGVVASPLAAFGAQAEIARALEQRITVAAECGDQQQTEQPHRVIMTVVGPDGRECDVSLHLQPQTGIDGIIGLLCLFISDKCEIPEGAGGLRTAETTHPDYDSAAGRSKAKDLHLPAGYRMTKVKVEKLAPALKPEREGQFKVFLGAAATGDTLPASLEFIEIGLEPFTAKPIAVQIAMRVQRPSGLEGTLSYERTFAATATVPEVHAAIAKWATGRGMATTSPNLTTLRITPDPATLLVRQASVAFFEDANAADLPPSSIEWRFNAR